MLRMTAETCSESYLWCTLYTRAFCSRTAFKCTCSQPPAMGSRQGARHLLSTYVHHTAHKKKLQLSVLETHLCHCLRIGEV